MKSLLWAFSFAALLSTSCKFGPSKSKVKEFEYSLDICRDLQQAVDKRWTDSLGMSKAAYHSKLVSQESSIIEYELPRYRRRLEEIKSNTGPANGPTGNEKPLATNTLPANKLPTNTLPANKLPTNTLPNQIPNGTSSKDKMPIDSYPSFPNGSLALTAASGQGSASVASEVCPGCDEAAVARKLSILERNRSAIGTCAYRDPGNSGNSTSAADPDQGLTPQEKAERAAAVSQMKGLIYAATQPKQLCDWFGRWSAGSGASRNRCKGEIVESFCKEFVELSGNIAVDAINDSGSGSRLGSQIVKPIPSLVKDTMIACSQQWAYDKMKQALRESTYWQLTDSIRDQAKDAILSDKLSPDAQAKKISDLKKNIALAVCKSGAGLIASQIDATPQVNYDNPCAAIWSVGKSRAKACLNTTASGCRIAAGDIDLRNFLPQGVTDDKPLATLTAEAVNTITKMGCDATGKVGSAACATISEAAAQIRSAITTGNNDWAHCLGTDQTGACAGTLAAEYWLGVKNADFKEPVRPPYRPADDPSLTVQDYCVCDDGCYEDDWGTDTQTARGQYATLIHANDAGTRDCKRQEGRWAWVNQFNGYLKSKSGYYLYWKTTNCQIRQLKDVTEVDNSTVSAEVRSGGVWARQNFSVGADAVCSSR